jgi:putative membrane-bound dehydrogenase-like protein
MRAPHAVLVLVVPSLLTATALAQQAAPKAPEDLTRFFEVPEGIEVKLWAESPLLSNPTAIDVDAEGRVWVAEGVNYRRWNGRNPGLERKNGDRIVVLADTAGSGACDRATIFAEDKDLVAPLGVCALGDKVIVSCSPSAFIYTDTDGDGKSDKKEVFLTGFGGHDHDHGLHSFVVGPDGRYWFAVGNAGPHIVTDKGGFHLRSGSLYRDGGEFPADNHPGLVSDDGRVWTGGLILRVDPDGKNLTVMAHNFRNEYEVALDSFGRFYTEDNDDDGNQGCRTLECLEGGNHGYFSADGSRYWSADRRPGQNTQDAHWHQDDPGVVPFGTINGAGGPTGVCVYESDVLGRDLDGCVLNADAGRNRVWAHQRKKKGSGQELVQHVLIAAKSGEGAEKNASWFRPSDVCVAPDGSVFVADWSDPGVGGHAAGDTQSYGRILHLVPKGRALSAAKFDVSTPKGRAEALASPNMQRRGAAASALRAMGSRAEGELLRLPLVEPANENAEARVYARNAWIEAGSSGFKLKDAQSLLDEVPSATIRAIRGGLRPKELRDPKALAQFYLEASKNPDPEVRAEVAIALRDLSFEDSAPALIQIALGYDGKDRRYLEAFGIGASGKEEQLWPLLVPELRGASAMMWSTAFTNIAWRLHPIAALDGLVERANSGGFPIEDRKQMIDALAFIRDRKAAEAVLNLAVGGPADTRSYAAWWIRNRDENDWREYKLAREVGGDSLADAELAASSGLVKTGAKDLDVALAGAKKLWLVVTDGGNGNSCDWADWIEPKLTTDRGEIALSSIPWTSAQAGWGDAHVGKNCNNGAIQVDGQKFADGIGTHAPSVIAYDLPAGATRLRVKAAVDDGGAKQASHATSVEFQVWIDSSARAGERRKLEVTLTSAATKPEDLEIAASKLCADRDGGFALIRLAETGKLPAPALAAVSKHIFQNPDISVRALASQHFTRPASNGAKMPSIAELSALTGDAARGAKLFFGTKAACSTCHTFAGRGGDVGPELTAVRSKYKTPELLDALLNPSAAIAFGYDAWLVETRDEMIYTGFILSEGDNVVIKDTAGKRHVVPLSEITSRTKQKLSLMPDNIAMGLAPQEIADLVLFLQSDPKQPGKRGTPVELFDGRTMEGWTYFLTDPKAKMEDVWSIHDGVLRCKGNPIGYIRTVKDYTNYVLDVDWRFDPKEAPGNSGVLLRMQAPDKVWPKSMEAQLQYQSAGDIWNIDEVSMVVDASRTDGRHTEKAQVCNENPIGEWNHYHITLDGGELTLEVNGVVQNHASWCDEVPGKICLQSEGAVIEFGKVTLTPIER